MGWENVSRAKYSGPKSDTEHSKCVLPECGLAPGLPFYAFPTHSQRPKPFRQSSSPPHFQTHMYQWASERLRFWVNFWWIWPQPRTSPTRQISSRNQKGIFYFSAGPPSPRLPSKDNLPPPSPFCNLNYTYGARLPSPSFHLKYACAPFSSQSQPSQCRPKYACAPSLSLPTVAANCVLETLLS